MRVSALTITEIDLVAKPNSEFKISYYGPHDGVVQKNRFGKELYKMKEYIKTAVANNSGTEEEKRVCLAIAMQVRCGAGLMASCSVTIDVYLGCSSKQAAQHVDLHLYGCR